MTVFAIPGHGAGDPGACAFGYSEAERVRALATRMKEIGGSGVELADFSRNYYADGGVSSLGIPSDWRVVELHMDSAGAGACGGHVIVQGSLSPDEWRSRTSSRGSSLGARSGSWGAPTWRTPTARRRRA